MFDSRFHDRLGRRHFEGAPLHMQLSCDSLPDPVAEHHGDAAPGEIICGQSRWTTSRESSMRASC